MGFRASFKMEERMKKILAALLVFCFLVGTSGCQKTYTVGQPENAGASGMKSEKVDTDQEETLFDFIIHIGDDVLKFPMEIEELTALGYVPDGTLEGMLKPQEINTEICFSKGNIKFRAEIYNSGIDTKALPECKVGGLAAETTEEGQEEQIALPGQIILGSSDTDAVRESYGVPGNIYHRDGAEIYSYENSASQQVLLYFKDGILAKIDIHNYVMDLPGDESETMVQNLETPEEVEEYQAPEVLDEDLKSTMVKLDDETYNLPAPVQQFLDAGWEIAPGELETVIYGEGTGQVTLTKGSSVLQVPVRNYSSKAAKLDGCFVTRLTVNESTGAVKAELPMGIGLGISEQDLKQALKAYEYTTEETDLSRSYFIGSLDSEQKAGAEDGVLVLVEKASEKVISISVTGTKLSEE